MKKSFVFSFLLLGLFLALSSCTIEKRHYMSGYNFNWNKSNSDLVESQKIENPGKSKYILNEPISNFELSNCYASNTTDLSLEKKSTPLSINKSDKISVLINKSPSIHSIKGKIIARTFKNVKQNENYEVNNRKGLAFSVVSFMTGLIGLLVIPLAFGLLAIIFGGIGLNKKLRGLAIAGLVLGIIDVLYGILIIAFVLSTV